MIGAGPLGRHLALLACRAGIRTVLEDVRPGNLRAAAEELHYGIARMDGGAAPAPGIAFAASIEDAVRAADLIVDFVPDELESKLEIFSLLDRMAPPHSIFATPTTALSIADLASCTYRPGQCIALELDASALRSAELPASIPIVQTRQTRPEALEAVRAFWSALGRRTEVRTAPALPGFGR